MILLFGIRGRLATLGTGRFFCPTCRGDRAYTRKGVRNWFTFFFIPIFPVSATKGVRIVCDTCQGVFSEDVLDLPTSDALRSSYIGSFRRCAVAVLKSGDASSAVARSAALASINGLLGEDHEIGDTELEADLARADPAQLAVAASPVANRLDSREAEWFFGACAQIALSDGPLSEDERNALRMLGESFNLSQAHQLGVIESLRAPSERAIDAPSDGA